MSASEVFPIAAVVPAEGQGADFLVAEFVSDLQKQGIAVRGLLQSTLRTDSGCEVFLTDINNGEMHGISQRLGKDSHSCSLDPGALANTSRVMQRALDEPTQLAVFNRFSGMEAEGKGFAQEMLALMSEGVPVLTIVQPRHLAAWRHFTGGMAIELPPEVAALRSWFEALSAVDRA